MNKIITVITAVVAKIADAFNTAIVTEEAQAKALVAKIDAAAKKGYARAESLTNLAAEIAVHSANHRTRAKSLNALAGRLDKAVN